jgi:hypothetical protein
VSAADFVKSASEEIDSKLGFTYVVPFKQTGDDALPDYQWKLIKDTAAKLASGRLLLAATSAIENATIHAYGLRMVMEAEANLMAIANGDVRLSARRVDASGDPIVGDPPNPQDEDPFAYIPGGSCYDATSPVLAFEENFMRPTYAPGWVETWTPRG